MPTMRYRYRAKLKPSQVEPINQLFGYTRVVYNDALAFCKAEYEAGRAKPTYNQLSAMLTQAKKTEEKAWLAKVSYGPLQQALRDLDRAFRNYFDVVTGKRKKPRGVKKVGSPKFKSRHGWQSAYFSKAAGFKVRETTHGVGFVRLAKIGWVRFELSRPLPSKPSSVTLIREPDGRHYVSFVVEVEPTPAPEPKAEAVAPKPTSNADSSSRRPTYTVNLPDTGHKALGAVTKDGDVVIVVRQASFNDLVEYGPKVLATLLERMGALEDKA